jgi:large subunit ribosomal protein L11
MPIPVVVNRVQRPHFEFVVKSPPAAALLKQGGGNRQGLGRAEQGQGGQGDAAQIAEIVKQEMADLNARDAEHACSMIAGTARSMGLEVVD